MQIKTASEAIRGYVLSHECKVLRGIVVLYLHKMYICQHQNPTVMYHTFLILNFGAPEIIIIGLIIVLLFGGKKIPELMKGLGKGVKSFKDGMKDVEDTINKDEEKKS